MEIFLYFSKKFIYKKMNKKFLKYMYTNKFIFQADTLMINTHGNITLTK